MVTAEDTQNDALVEEMLRDVESKKFELPSELSRDPVIHRGDATLPAPMVAQKVTSAGHVYVYDTRTKQKAPVLYYMLHQILRTRRKDGSVRWTVIDPGEEPTRGQYQCLLHKSDPSRKGYDDLGFPVCPRDHLANRYEVRRHMQLKHRAEWAAIEEDRKDRERQEDREMQQKMMEAMAGKAQTPVESQVEPEVQTPKFICDSCGQVCKSAFGLRSHNRQHNRTKT